MFKELTMSKNSRIDNSRNIKAPRGSKLNAKSWLTEAPLRMLMNNLDPEVAENPQELVVYGGIGRAARNWQSFDQIQSKGNDRRRMFPHPVLSALSAICGCNHSDGK